MLPDVAGRLGRAFATAMGTYVNLATLIFAPSLPDDALFSAVIGSASSCPNLRRLLIKTTTFSEDVVKLLCKIKTITILELVSPNSYVLLALPNSFHELCRPLEGLHLKV